MADYPQAGTINRIPPVDWGPTPSRHASRGLGRPSAAKNWIRGRDPRSFTDYPETTEGSRVHPQYGDVEELKPE